MNKVPASGSNTISLKGDLYIIYPAIASIKAYTPNSPSFITFKIDCHERPIAKERVCFLF
jgi:hypothetical protein